MELTLNCHQIPSLSVLLNVQADLSLWWCDTLHYVGFAVPRLINEPRHEKPRLQGFTTR